MKRPRNAGLRQKQSDVNGWLNYFADLLEDINQRLIRIEEYFSPVMEKK